MTSEEIIAGTERYLMHTYARQPLALTRGAGCRVYDPEEREYIDFVSGVAVDALGHCAEEVTSALNAQADTLMHVSNLYHTEPQVQLAKLLVEHSFADKVFFCNSGAEANETAIKLTRQYAAQTHGLECYEIIAMENSFHGRTMATIAATGQPRFHAGIGPLLPGILHIPFNDIGAAKRAITASTAGVLVEPIQGEGGVVAADRQFLQELRDLCDRFGSLLIFDEVQTGVGRTGQLFAYEHDGVIPDIMTLAKGLGGGVPIGACLAVDRVAQAFSPGMHGCTLGGNPLVCAAARAVMQRLLERNGLLDHCRVTGQYFVEKLHVLKEMFGCIQDVRGRGLLLGLALSIEGKHIVDTCREQGFLINCTSGRVLRFIPPLTISREDIDRLCDVLTTAFQKTMEETAS
ncbi:MAG TPA: aspartate aminotransferase family protein [Nitrospirales bacterium]|nr:aspartate aminotransferase family protein [Nitrospirales bacterium]